jgi:lipoprotein-releasing system permease protein
VTFELLIATRYLRAKRKQAMISVITVIAMLGVSAGVAALVVAMAVSEGQRQDIRDKLLGAQAHLTVYSTGREGIPNYLEVARQIEQIPGVIGAAPHAEQYMVISTTLTPVRVTGIVPELDARVSLLSKSIIAGNLADLSDQNTAPIVIGQELAKRQSLEVGDRVNIMSAAGSGGPSGMERRSLSFKVVAIFSIGLYEYDSALVYVPFERATHLMAVGNVATNIEVKTSDIDRSEQVGQAIIAKLGSGFIFDDWKVTHKTIFQALNLERLGMAIAIGLIVFVASLNIIATLTMMVLEKTRDIATLMAMGATVSQIRRVFILQGVIIGAVGTALGLVLGHGISYFADKYRLIPLSPEIYSIDRLPFQADPWDSVIIAAAAILISFLATLYPSAAASRLQPVEALRYE